MRLSPRRLADDRDHRGAGTPHGLPRLPRVAAGRPVMTGPGLLQGAKSVLVIAKRSIPCSF
jgi:hypothetical protein